MEQLNINHILDRNQEEKKFIECLEHFEKEKQNILITDINQIVKKLNAD